MTLRVSVELSHVCPLGDIINQVRAMESLGFYRAWVPDTLVSPWDAWLAAGLIAQNTSTLRIGLGVTNPYTRHPVAAAQMAATLQTVSSGRLSLAVGRGIPRFLAKAGITEHFKAVEEFITVLRPLIAGERTSFQGEVFKIDGIKLRTVPPDRPVPLYMAAAGPSGWETAVRIADGVSTFYGEEIFKIRRRLMAERPLPTSALIPFALTQKDFFAERVSDPDELKKRADVLEGEGFDELIVAYADMNDLEAAAGLLGR